MPTVVFADIVGSTGLFEQLGGANASQLMNGLTTQLGKVFEQHQGRVVKLLGDGVFAVFADAGSAVTARLADLAGADQILTTQNVWDALIAAQRPSLRSLGPMQLRGKAQTTHIYRVEWQTGRDLDATAMGASMYVPAKQQPLGLTMQGRTHFFEVTTTGITIGRSTDASLPVLDPRVSRIHATISRRGGQIVLADASSFGTWVYFGNQTEAVALRRSECFLVGYGQISLGCKMDADKAPLVAFEVT